MSDYEPTQPNGTISGAPVTSETSEPSVAERAADTGTMSPPPSTSSPNWSVAEPVAKRGGRPTVRRLLANKRRRWIVVASLLMCAVIGLSVGLVTAGSTTAAPTVPVSGHAGASGFGSGASNARSGPATGGASGTVGSVSASGFVM